MLTIYSADVNGNPSNCSYPHKHVILDEDTLKAAICHDYVCAEYQNSYRNNDNFIPAVIVSRLIAIMTILKIQMIGLHQKMYCRHFQE